MYRGSQYYISQASLEFFANAFNALDIHKNIRWEYIRDESYKNDGYFINIETGETFGFDWEIRDDYFTSDTFPFKTFGQFERKMDPSKSIKLSIQCNKPCSCIAVGWHEDFEVQPTQAMALATDTAQKENGTTRYTEHFRLFKYTELAAFKELIKRAFETNTYNHTIFEYIGNRPYQQYHIPTCKYAPKDPQKRVVFNTLADVQNSGYQPCKECRPPTS